MSADAKAPVIIKRKKIVGGGGHHGGAWKVAYADFVTAMMAFFLLMWLLNATTEKQRKGIADYFNPTIPINRISGGGDGAFGGDSIFSESTLARSGSGATQRNPAEEKAARGDTGAETANNDREISSAEDAETLEAQAEAEQKAMTEMADMLTARSGESMVSEGMARHILVKVTDEGLIVEVFDLPDEPLFAEGSATPLPVMTELAGLFGTVFSLVRNEVAISGFVRSEPVVLASNPVWDLSSARADRVRILLTEKALPDRRVQRVSGFADRKPAVRNPMAVRNNRIELVLLRRFRPGEE